MYFDLNYIIEQVGKEKGIPKETLIEALEEAILIASKKKFGNHLDLEARYNEELGEIEVFQFKTVWRKSLRMIWKSLLRTPKIMTPNVR